MEVNDLKKEQNSKECDFNLEKWESCYNEQFMKPNIINKAARSREQNKCLFYFF